MSTQPVMLLAMEENSELVAFQAALEAEYAVAPVPVKPDEWPALENAAVLLMELCNENDADNRLERLSSCGVLSHMPVLLLVSQNDTKTETKALTLGAADVLRKPIAIEPLLQRIHRAREQFRRATELEDAGLHLRGVMDSVPGGIVRFALSPHARLTYYNDGICAMLGYERDEFHTFTEKPLDLVHPEDAVVLRGQIRAFVDDPRPASNTFRAFHKDGHELWLRMSSAPMMFEGNVLHCTAVIQDVTRERESEIRVERALRDARYVSEHDTLTGLCNRETFVKRTALMIETNSEIRYKLVALDVQRFKAVNELFGVEKGNELLLAIGKCMRRLYTGIGIFGRMEADHFAVCLPAEQLDMDKLISTIDKAIHTLLPDYFVHTCFGIYSVHSSRVPVGKMYERASLAIRSIKGSAVHRCAEYDENMRNELLKQQAIEDEMEGALEQGQFVLYLQPMYALEGVKLQGAEVLVRWLHPEKGLISPGDFIPLFERNGFITKLDAFVWESAVALLKKWCEKGIMLPISVNLSRVDVYQPRLFELLVGLVERYEVEPSMVKLEVTESAYTANPSALVPVLNKLRDFGFSILMDDFGAGYSSLNALKDMPVDTLKIDMKFLHELENSPRAGSILSSVVSMAKKLDMPVVAEGVENEKQIDFLKEVGCECAQGFYFARPMQVSDFETLLEAAMRISLTPRRGKKED